MALTNETYRTWMTFALVLTGFVVCVFWYRWNLAQKHELDALSSWAAGGHLESVRRLSEIGSAEARKRAAERT